MPAYDLFTYLRPTVPLCLSDSKCFPVGQGYQHLSQTLLFYLNHILPTCIGRLICRPHRSCWLANSPSAGPSGVNPFYSDRDVAYVAYETAQRVLQHSVPLETRSRFQLLYPGNHSLERVVIAFQIPDSSQSEQVGTRRTGRPFSRS
jgi:hypothetical protein